MNLNFLMLIYEIFQIKFNFLKNLVKIWDYYIESIK